MAALPSCQKVIDVDLNSSDPQYIIEGNINDGPSPYSVKLSRSANFSSGNSFPAVNGAVVTVRDETDQLTDTLIEATPGLYQTSRITGRPGHAYSLYIKTGDRTFTARSVMPMPVVLDTIEIQKSVFGGDDLYPVPVYRDPTGQGNRYRISASVNSRAIKDYDVRSDEITDGQVARFPFYYDTDDESGNPRITAGDSVTISLLTIDSAVYEFYRTLADTRDQEAAALSNPLSNIKGGAMGYFSAGAIRRKSVLVR